MEPQPEVPSASDLLDLLCDVERPHRPIHLMAYGDFGSKKSTLIASMPKPQLGHLFDPLDKGAPYFRDGRIGEWTETGYPETTVWDAFGTPVIQVWHPTEDKIIRLIEHYVDDDPYNPTAYARYNRRMGITKGIKVAQTGPMGSFTREYVMRFGTIWWDSLTFFGLARRKWDEFVLNQFSARGNTQDGKQWWGAEASAIENEILRRATSLPVNTAVAAHVADDKVDINGHAILSIGGPGKLPRRLPAGFGEVYRAHTTGIGPERKWRLQTNSDAMYAACTQISAPDGCEPSYEALWVNA